MVGFDVVVGMQRGVCRSKWWDETDKITVCRLCTYVQGLVTCKTEGKYMVDGITSNVIGIVIGLASIIIAVYSVIKQKNLNQDLKKKKN